MRSDESLIARSFPVLATVQDTDTVSPIDANSGVLVSVTTRLGTSTNSNGTEVTLFVSSISA